MHRLANGWWSNVKHFYRVDVRSGKRSRGAETERPAKEVLILSSADKTEVTSRESAKFAFRSREAGST